jgi:threonine dehydratase
VRPVVELADIRRAAERLKGVPHRTELRRSSTFSDWAACDVHLKYENRQRTGSFKIRGAYNRISELSYEERAAGVVAASAGNHAQGVALAASLAGVPATVFMPVEASLVKVDATRAYGATVELVTGGFEGALRECDAAASGGKTLVHPFDDELIIAGQGTVGLEILEDVPDLDTVVVPLGGGGLISGIAIAIKEQRPEVRLVGVEVAGYAPYARPEDTPSTNGEPPDTIADGIAVKQPGTITLDLVRRYVDDVVTVRDEDTGQAIVHLLEREKTVVEGAGAVGLAALLTGRVSGRRVAVVISGGNIDTPRLMQVIRFGLTHSGRYLMLRTRVSDRPGQLMGLLRLIADERVNVLLVQHQREGLDMSVAETGLELTLETRGEAHARALIAELRRGGYPVTRVH